MKMTYERDGKDGRVLQGVMREKDKNSKEDIGGTIWSGKGDAPVCRKRSISHP
jgi:hypothetical protein